MWMPPNLIWSTASAHWPRQSGVARVLELPANRELEAGSGRSKPVPKDTTVDMTIQAALFADCEMMITPKG